MNRRSFFAAIAGAPVALASATVVTFASSDGDTTIVEACDADGYLSRLVASIQDEPAVDVRWTVGDDGCDIALGPTIYVSSRRPHLIRPAG